MLSCGWSQQVVMSWQKEELQEPRERGAWRATTDEDPPKAAQETSDHWGREWAEGSKRHTGAGMRTTTHTNLRWTQGPTEESKGYEWGNGEELRTQGFCVKVATLSWKVWSWRTNLYTRALNYCVRRFALRVVRSQTGISRGSNNSDGRRLAWEKMTIWLGGARGKNSADLDRRPGVKCLRKKTLSDMLWSLGFAKFVWSLVG